MVAVAFTPPDASPAEIGVLMDGRVDALELSSTLVDLAARRLIAIESTGSGFRFTLLQQPPGTRLKNYESSLLATMFGSGTVVTSAELNKNRKAGQRFVKLLDEAVRAKGWMIRHGRTGSVGLRGAGVMITWLGLMFTAFVAAFGFALAGLPILLLGVGLFALSFKRASYKAKGSAVRAQAEAFKLYLSTAERDTLRFEEGVEIFSRYLPYAMVFGVADRWAGLFESLAREGVYRADTSWYHGSDISRASGFAGSMSSLSTSLSSVTRSAVSSRVGGGTRGSSGGSGSSGGGGMGGSGGSSW